MPKSHISEILLDIKDSLNIVNQRVKNIKSAEDFIKDEDAIILFDSVVMRLQVIGELTKALIKADSLIPAQYPDIEWNNIIRMRDKISHHYLDLDAEVIWDICSNYIPKLQTIINKMIQEYLK